MVASLLAVDSKPSSCVHDPPKGGGSRRVVCLILTSASSTTTLTGNAKSSAQPATIKLMFILPFGAAFSVSQPQPNPTGAVASDDGDQADTGGAGRSSAAAAAAWTESDVAAGSESAKLGCVVRRIPARATAERAKRSMGLLQCWQTGLRQP